MCQAHFCLKIRNEAIARDKDTEKLYQHVIAISESHKLPVVI